MFPRNGIRWLSGRSSSRPDLNSEVDRRAAESAVGRNYLSSIDALDVAGEIRDVNRQVPFTDCPFGSLYGLQIPLFAFSTLRNRHGSPADAAGVLFTAS